MPAELVETYEAMLDQADGIVARERLVDIEAGHVVPMSSHRSQTCRNL